jgi:hypothetical protein
MSIAGSATGGTPICQTLVLVWDDPEDDDSDFPRRYHYECRECRARVEPATMASPQRRFIPGLRP